MLRGVDIQQSEIDIGLRALVSRADFAICRATQGDFEDVAFNGTGTYSGIRRFLFHEIRDNGLVPGAYHFLTRSDSDQALTFVRALKAANHAHADGALCVLVVEHDMKHGSIPIADDVQRFITRFQELCPMQPLFVMTNTTFWGSRIKVDLQAFDNVYVWLQKWSDTSGEIDAINPRIPSEWWDTKVGGRKPTLIQFTSQAFVDGTRVFGSVYRGDRKSLQRLAEVALPSTLRQSRKVVPYLPVPGYRPTRASDTDVAKEKGRTTILAAGALLGVAAIVGAVGIMVWANTRDFSEPIFDDAL
jgi:hypothetical protein